MRVKQKIRKPELLAPAGNLEKMKTAFAFGADAVYAGIPDFSLRVRINDFTISGIKKATDYAHKLSKKIYVTVNIFAHNRHIDRLPAHIKKLKEIGVDGIFISDPAVLQNVKKIWPKAKIILSTQANCTNWQAAKYWYDQGVSRVILSRELSVNEIKEIHKKVPKLELECFVHGAMCMAYSGRCFLSKFFVDRDANLGDCVQPCRWKYKIQIATDRNIDSHRYFIQTDDRDELLELVEEKHGSYILNSQDLCLIKRLDELVNAGISAFKIEGRAKSVYYLATVVGAYRKAIDLVTCNLKLKTYNKELDFLFKELEEKLYHRGYSEGFIFGQGRLAQNIKESHKKCNWEFCGQVVRIKNHGLRIKNNKKITYQIYIKVHNSLKVGDKIEVIKPSPPRGTGQVYDIIKIRVKKMVDSESGEELKEAHGGQGKVVVIESDIEVPKYSVARRKV